LTLHYRHLHLTRLVLFNILATAPAVAAYLQGWLDGVVQVHLSELSGLIFVVFLYGLVHCAIKTWRHGLELNQIEAGAPNAGSAAGSYVLQALGTAAEGRILRAEALRLRLTDSIVVVRHVADSLIFLGLIGTVIGFIVALSGVDPATAGEVENVTALVATLINGMSIALYTTLVCAVFYIWLIINYRILVTATVALIGAALGSGEGDAWP
jgi:hypothetical protein